jgi:hypothetical protein
VTCGCAVDPARGFRPAPILAADVCTGSAGGLTRRTRGRRSTAGTSGAFGPSGSTGIAKVGTKLGRTRRAGASARIGSARASGVGCTGCVSAGSSSPTSGRPCQRSWPLRDREVASCREARDVRVCLTSTVNGRALRRFMCVEILRTSRSAARVTPREPTRAYKIHAILVEGNRSGRCRENHNLSAINPADRHGMGAEEEPGSGSHEDWPDCRDTHVQGGAAGPTDASETRKVTSRSARRLRMR